MLVHVGYKYKGSQTESYEVSKSPNFILNTWIQKIKTIHADFPAQTTHTTGPQLYANPIT